MAIDLEALMRIDYAPRTQAVRVAELDRDGDEAVWTVRGLTANEIARANDAQASSRKESALVEALVSGRHGKLVQELQSALGRNPDDVHPDVARRIEILAAGSVEPACTVDKAVWLADKFPVVFFNLTNTILTLSGRGSDVEKKPQSSGPTQESAPP